MEIQQTRLDELPSWAALEANAAELKGQSLASMFDADASRADEMSVDFDGYHYDYSKQLASPETIKLLIACAREAGIEERIKAMFAGQAINVSEDRSVLHLALRAPRGEEIFVDGVNVVDQVHEVLDRMGDFSDKIRSGEWKGATGKPIRNVVNIGIGGSHLGPEMATIALAHYSDREMKFRFVSNVDGSDFAEKTLDLDPEETLFIIVSKTFVTLETLTNAGTARDWIVGALGEDSVEHHFVAVSTNAEGVAKFGINTDNMFGFWDWVGGRYSMDSSVGLTIMCAIGRENFAAMLAGFHAVDEHLRSAPLEANMPVLMGLVGVWNRNLLKLPTVAILPYVAEMARFPAYLQQLEMESNGKHVMLNGEQVGWDTAAVFWGEPGTNGQHAFYQMIHQGTEIVPTEFIGFCDPIYPLGNHHDLLMANMFAQAEALAFGRDAETLRAAGSPQAQISARICLGDRPSTTLLIDGQLTPRALGTLVALYEHRAFTEGVLWGIDSFDQWGVELGKVLAGTLADQLTDADKPDLQHDSSTNSLARRYRASQKRPV